MSEHTPDVDQPEPEDVLSGAPARRPEHEFADEDDREVPLDDPSQPDPPIDDDDRDPAGPPPP
jgi:hypothetical protein